MPKRDADFGLFAQALHRKVSLVDHQRAADGQTDDRGSTRKRGKRGRKAEQVPEAVVGCGGTGHGNEGGSSEEAKSRIEESQGLQQHLRSCFKGRKLGLPGQKFWRTRF